MAERAVDRQPAGLPAPGGLPRRTRPIGRVPDENYAVVQVDRYNSDLRDDRVSEGCSNAIVALSDVPRA